MSRLLAIATSKDDREAADYFTRYDFLKMLERYKKDVRQLSPEACADIKTIVEVLKSFEVQQ